MNLKCYTSCRQAKTRFWVCMPWGLFFYNYFIFFLFLLFHSFFLLHDSFYLFFFFSFFFFIFHALIFILSVSLVKFSSCSLSCIYEWSSLFARNIKSQSFKRINRTRASFHQLQAAIYSWTWLWPRGLATVYKTISHRV